MSGPVYFNQVIFQTPTVEKIQQPEFQNPDQTQRHASVQEQVQLREKTETVQTPVETESTRFVENEGKKRRESGQKKKRGGHLKESASEETETPPDRDQGGGIIDVVI